MGSEYVDIVWTLKATMGLVSGVPITLAFLVTARQFLRDRQRPYFLLAAHWFLWVACDVLYVLQNALPAVETLLTHLNNFLVFVGGFALLGFVDLITRERLDTVKFTLYGTTWGAGFAFSLANQPLLGTIFTSVALLGLTGLWLYHAVRIHRHVPASFKRNSSLNVAGIFMFGVLALLFSRRISGLSVVVPSIDRLVMSAGILLVAVAMAREPQLAYVLPFQVYRLVVYDWAAGIPLFNHEWRKEQTFHDQDLFSGMLQALNRVVLESVDLGEIREIHLAEGILLLHRSREPAVVCVLVANASTRALRLALREFAEEYARNLGSDPDNPVKIAGGAAGTSLVARHFPFVPQYA